ncbi:hypothetical protein [Swingsia samuiensis]|uniref:Uncharacterized protein n=1 Tax=Swingsia samuiensis TaxID=1293412 RepID=A0A4Y6UIE5_9PROT|nr:hypothetical protein [Swingsia samuiensis]QDH17353.1 hypothetical protein E3D00_07105 [Swingsia samuiensis]
MSRILDTSEVLGRQRDFKMSLQNEEHLSHERFQDFLKSYEEKRAVIKKEALVTKKQIQDQKKLVVPEKEKNSFALKKDQSVFFENSNKIKTSKNEEKENVGKEKSTSKYKIERKLDIHFKDIDKTRTMMSYRGGIKNKEDAAPHENDKVLEAPPTVLNLINQKNILPDKGEKFILSSLQERNEEVYHPSISEKKNEVAWKEEDKQIKENISVEKKKEIKFLKKEEKPPVEKKEDWKTHLIHHTSSKLYIKSKIEIIMGKKGKIVFHIKNRKDELRGSSSLIKIENKEILESLVTHRDDIVKSLQSTDFLNVNHINIPSVVLDIKQMDTKRIR